MKTQEKLSMPSVGNLRTELRDVRPSESAIEVDVTRDADSSHVHYDSDGHSFQSSEHEEEPPSNPNISVSEVDLEELPKSMEHEKRNTKIFGAMKDAAKNALYKEALDFLEKKLAQQGISLKDNIKAFEQLVELFDGLEDVGPMDWLLFYIFNEYKFAYQKESERYQFLRKRTGERVKPSTYIMKQGHQYLEMANAIYLRKEGSEKNMGDRAFIVSKCSAIDHVRQVEYISTGNKYPAFMIVRMPQQNRIVIAIRGTFSVPDMLTDIDFREAYFPGTNIRIHRGVYLAIQEIENEIFTNLNLRWMVKKRPGISPKKLKVVFCGHSLGGGCAQLLALRMNHKVGTNWFNQEKTYIPELAHMKIQCFTFGGLPVWSSHLGPMDYSRNRAPIFNNFHNFINKDDLVPSVSQRSLRDLNLQLRAVDRMEKFDFWDRANLIWDYFKSNNVNFNSQRMRNAWSKYQASYKKIYNQEGNKYQRYFMIGKNYWLGNNTAHIVDTNYENCCNWPKEGNLPTYRIDMTQKKPFDKFLYIALHRTDAYPNAFKEAILSGQYNLTITNENWEVVGKAYDWAHYPTR